MITTDIVSKIRGLIRDGNSTISDETILSVYNRKRRTFYAKVEPSVRVWVCPNPPRFNYAYSSLWEERYLPAPSWRFSFSCIENLYAYTQEWEITEVITGNEGSDGGYCVTSSSDILDVEQENPIPYPLPEDFSSPIMLLWKGKHLSQITKSELNNYDIDWNIRHSGDPYYWTMEREYGNGHFLPYPIPTHQSIIGTGEGIIIYTDGDLEWDEYGPVTYIPTMDPEFEAEGVVSDIIPASESFVLFYYTKPVDLSAGDEELLPSSFVTYINFAAAAELLRSRTILRDQMLQEFYRLRSEVGQELITRAKTKLQSGIKRVIDSILSGSSKGRPRRPRLPDHYPKVEY